MAPFSLSRPIKQSFRGGTTLVVALCLSSIAQAIAEDPITVLFDKACHSQVLEIQIWNRIEKRWSHHPEHPKILAGSCQVEDAGYLMNEIRVRCMRTDDRSIEPWIDGIKVYEPGVVNECTLPTARDPIIEISSPEPGAIIQNETRLVRVEGRILFEKIQKTVPRNEVAARLLDELALSQPSVKAIQIQNLTQGESALEVDYQDRGRFSALVGLKAGENLIRIHVVDERGRQGDITLPLVFDISLLREKWLETERDRIERFRQENREGRVDVDVVDP